MGSPQTSAEGGADSIPRSVQIELSGFRELLFSRLWLEVVAQVCQIDKCAHAC